MEPCPLSSNTQHLIGILDLCTVPEVSSILETLEDASVDKTNDSKSTLLYNLLKRAQDDPQLYLICVDTCIQGLQAAAKLPDTRRQRAAKVMKLAHYFGRKNVQSVEMRVIELVALCATDNWSEVRKDTAKNLKDWPKHVPQSWTEGVCTKLVQICSKVDGEQLNWKALEGGLISLHSLISTVEKNLIEPEFFTSLEEKASLSYYSFQLGQTVYGELPQIILHAYESCFQLVMRVEVAVRKGALALISSVQELEGTGNLPQLALNRGMAELSRCKEDYEFEGLIELCMASVTCLSEEQLLSRWDNLCQSMGATSILGHSASTVRQAVAMFWVKMAGCESAARVFRSLLALSDVFDSIKEEESSLALTKIATKKPEKIQPSMAQEHMAVAESEMNWWKIKETIIISYEAILGAVVSAHMKEIGRRGNGDHSDKFGDRDPRSILEQLGSRQDSRLLSDGQPQRDFTSFLLHIMPQVALSISALEFELRRMAVQFVPTFGRYLLWQDPNLLIPAWECLQLLDGDSTSGDGFRVACEMMSSTLRHCRHLLETHINASSTKKVSKHCADSASPPFKLAPWGNSHIGIGDSMIAQQSDLAVYQAAGNAPCVESLCAQYVLVLKEMDTLLKASSQTVELANGVAPGLMEVLVLRRAFYQGWKEFRRSMKHEEDSLTNSWDMEFCTRQLAAFHRIVYSPPNPPLETGVSRETLPTPVAPICQLYLEELEAAFPTPTKAPPIQLYLPCSASSSHQTRAATQSNSLLSFDRALSAGLVQALPETLKSIVPGSGRFAFYPFVAHWLQLEDNIRWVPCGGLISGTLLLIEALQCIFIKPEQPFNQSQSIQAWADSSNDPAKTVRAQATQENGSWPFVPAVILISDLLQRKELRSGAVFKAFVSVLYLVCVNCPDQTKKSVLIWTVKCFSDFLDSNPLVCTYINAPAFCSAIFTKYQSHLDWNHLIASLGANTEPPTESSDDSDWDDWDEEEESSSDCQLAQSMAETMTLCLLLLISDQNAFPLFQTVLNIDNNAPDDLSMYGTSPLPNDGVSHSLGALPQAVLPNEVIKSSVKLLLCEKENTNKKITAEI